MEPADHTTDRPARRLRRRHAIRAVAGSAALIGVSLARGRMWRKLIPRRGEHRKLDRLEQPVRRGRRRQRPCARRRRSGAVSSAGAGAGAVRALAIARRQPRECAEVLGLHARERGAQLPRPQRPGRDPVRLEQRHQSELAAVPGRLAEVPQVRGRGAPPSPAQQAQTQAQALRFAACMRAHGVPRFPDPQFSGGGVQFRVGGPSGGGIDPSSPLFQKAQKACAPDLPGELPKVAPGG